MSTREPSIRNSLRSAENQKLTPEEKRKFSKIYNKNFEKILSNIKKPELIRGIELPEITGPKSFLDCSVIDESMTFQDGALVYTEGFKELIEKIDKIIYDDSKKDDIKYVLIGECLKDSHCNKNDLKFRLIKHILSYLDKIVHNKSKLLNEMELLNIECIKIIGNCDYENFEGISNKEIEEIIRSIDFAKIPIYAAMSLSYLIYKLPKETAKMLFIKINNFLRPRNQITKKKKADVAAQVEVVAAQLEAVLNTKESQPETIRDTVNRYLSTVSKSFNIKEFKDAKEITKQAREISSLARAEIMTLHELHKQGFCSSIEVAKLHQKTKDSPYWLTIPRLTMMIMSSSSLITSFSFAGTGTTSTTLTDMFNKNHSTIDALVLSTFLSSVLTPLVGTIIALGIGTLLESEFYKNLRDSRRINIQFMKLISDTEAYPAISKAQYAAGERCSFRNDSEAYIEKFQEVNTIIDTYKAKSKEYFDDHCDKLYFYLFVYNFVCKIKPQERNAEPNATNLDNPAPAPLSEVALRCQAFATELRNLFVITAQRETEVEEYQRFKSKLSELKNYLNIEMNCDRDITQAQLNDLINSLNAVRTEQDIARPHGVFRQILCERASSRRRSGGKSSRKKIRRIFKTRKLTKKNTK